MGVSFFDWCYDRGKKTINNNQSGVGITCLTVLHLLNQKYDRRPETN